MSKTYTVELTIEVKMTRPGYPGRGPDFNSPGEPPEPPELEITEIFVNNHKISVDAGYKLYKEEREKRGYKVQPYDPSCFRNYDQFFADSVYNEVLNRAYEDDWSDEYDDYDPTP